MASYVDNIPVFRPYVQQLPVEAMVSVGMEKQRRYDEGYQRIQSQIDKIAGLSIMKDVDKQYLQSKMNQLGANLRMVSMGDLSNYQLVNSIGGMVSKIGKDKNIQNAVYSTANISKQRDVMENARRTGEWAPENEYDYQKRLQPYLNSTIPGELFNDQYTPYIDVNKKITAIAKEVGLDEKTVQILYATDANGNPLTYTEDTVDALGKHKKGDIQWNPVMVEKHLKGKDAGKILDAFQAALTPADYNQLGITGRYVKSGYTSDQLREEIVNGYNEHILSVNAKIEEAKIELASEQTKNNKDAKDNDKISSLEKKLEIFQNEKIKLINAQKRDLSTLDRDPDSVRASLYTNSYLTRMARDLSSMTDETKYSVSPQLEATLKINDFNRQVQRDKISDYHWSVEQKRADEKFEWEKEKDRLELQLKYGKGTAEGIPAPINTKDAAVSVLAAAKDDFIAKVADLNATNYEIAKEYFKQANPGETDDQIKERIFNYAKSKGKPFNFGSEEVNEAVADLASNQIGEWKKNPTKVPFELRDLIKAQYNLTRTLSIDTEQMKRMKEEAYSRAEEEGVKVPTEKEIQDKINPISIELNDLNGVPSGERVNLSREDVINLANLFPEKFNLFGRLTVDNQQERSKKSAQNRLLTKYDPKKLSQIITSIYGVYISPTDVVSPNLSLNMNDPSVGFESVPLSTVSKVHGEVAKAGRLMNDSKYKRLSEIEAQVYLEHGYVKQPLGFPVLRGKENKDDINAKVIQIINNYSSGLNEISEFNPEEMKSIVLSGKDDAVSTLATPELDGSISYTMTIEGAGKSQTMKINESEWTYITNQKPLSNMKEPMVSKQIGLYGTSGHNGSNAPDAAWFPSDEFTNLKGTQYSATGNLVKDARNQNNLWLKLYVTDNKTGESFPLTYDIPIPKMIEGSHNPYLDNVPEAITPAVINGLRNSQNK